MTIARQPDLFREDPEPPDPAELKAAETLPLAAPCGYRNRRNEPCRRLADHPLVIDGQQLTVQGRPLLQCVRACFDEVAGPDGDGDDWTMTST